MVNGDLVSHLAGCCWLQRSHGQAQIFRAWRSASPGVCVHACLQCESVNCVLLPMRVWERACMPSLIVSTVPSLGRCLLSCSLSVSLFSSDRPRLQSSRPQAPSILEAMAVPWLQCSPANVVLQFLRSFAVPTTNSTLQTTAIILLRPSTAQALFGRLTLSTPVLGSVWFLAHQLLCLFTAEALPITPVPYLLVIINFNHLQSFLESSPPSFPPSFFLDLSSLLTTRPNCTWLLACKARKPVLLFDPNLIPVVSPRASARPSENGH